MQKTIHGVIHGTKIELTEDPGLLDGQAVEVTVKPALERLPSGEGWKRLAGLLADDWTEEDDRILEQLRRDRKIERRLPE